MKFSDNFKKNFETSDNSKDQELCTHYYRAKASDGINAVKELVSFKKAKLVDENEDYLELLFEGNDFSCTAKITATTPVEIGIDFNIITYGFISFGKGFKLIKSFYEFLDKKLSLKGISLYRG